jgi:predicted transcriptional regulator
MAMATQIIIRLPDDIAQRLRMLVPARQRNKFVTDLVESAVANREKELEHIAAVVTAEEQGDPALVEERKDWDGVIGDGLDEIPPYESA